MEYSPVDCGFHDRLESLAVQRIRVPVEVSEDGAVHVVEARIADVFSRDGAEYARLVEARGHEREVRLDRINSVAGIPRPGAG